MTGMIASRPASWTKRYCIFKSWVGNWLLLYFRATDFRCEKCICVSELILFSISCTHLVVVSCPEKERNKSQPYDACRVHCKTNELGFTVKVKWYQEEESIVRITKSFPSVKKGDKIVEILTWNSRVSFEFWWHISCRYRWAQCYRRGKRENLHPWLYTWE